MLAGAAVLLAGLSGCAGASDDHVATEATATSRDEVVVAFGRAMFTGDTAAMVDLLEPGAASTLSKADKELLAGLSPTADDVEVRHLAYETVSIDDDTLEVRYTGERCAPTQHTQFPETTAVAGPGDSGSSAAAGVQVDGEVTCASIADQQATRPPTRFVQVDGQWYATLPGF